MLNKGSVQSITVPTTPIVDANTDEQLEIIRYAEWLTTEAQRNNNGSYQEESRKYAEDALRTVTVKGQEFRPFAPFRHALSAYKSFTRRQVVVLSTIMLGCGLGLFFYGMKLVIVIIAMITVLYFSSLILDFLLIMLALNQSTDEQIDDAIVHALADVDWPRYTILCPLYREAEVVPQFVQAMQALDYPADKLQILFLTEENDEETRKAIAAMHLPQHFSIVTVPDGKPRTKPRACNFGLLQATGDYVVIYDAEDVPDPLQLKKAVLTFANHDSDVACVQAKLNYYNGNQNLLTRWFTVEYCLWFDLMLPGMQQTKLPLPLGGTSNHFRMEMLHRVGAWDPFNVTEDCDLGLRLARSGLKTIVLNSITYEEANSQLKNWIRQRSRWIKGYLLTYLVYMREPLRYLRPGRLREFLSLQLVIGGKTAVLFVNPLMWVLLAIYILFRPVDVYHTLFPGPILYMGTLCLIFGNFFYTYIHLIGCMKLSRFSLIKWALSIPIYWAMMTVAASLALYQLIFKPHYWEKTKHGLHLRSSHSSSGRTTVEEEPQSEVTMQLPAFTSTKHASPPLPAPHSSSASTTVEEEPKSVATMQSPAFTSTKGVPPLLPAPRAFSGSTAYHGRSAWWTMIILPAPRASSGSTAEEEDLEVTDKRPAIRNARHLSSPLPASPSFSGSTTEEEDLEVTDKRPAIRNARHLSSPLPASPSFSGSTTEEEDLEVIEKLPTVRRAQRLFVHYLKRLPLQHGLKDPWLILTFVVACIASSAACWYFFQHHQILLQEDALSRVRIARRVFDNSPPGFGQLGGVWMPLPQVLMLPFVWNDYLWRTGLAGSFVGMFCYMVSVIYLFLSARRLTQDSRASFVGTLLFILNPNILYVQATPLSETVCIAMIVITCYYFLAWTQDNHVKHLVGMAAGCFLATLARYDGWGLFLVLLVSIVVVAWIKRQRWEQIESNLLVFGTLGALGIGLWMLWCWVIFGDPLYFHNFTFALTKGTHLANTSFYTYHNMRESIYAYMILSIKTVGPILCVLAFIAVVIFVFRFRRMPSTIVGAVVFLTPFAFYFLTFYTGQVTIYLPGVGTVNEAYGLWNVRFGTQAVAPAAFFLSILAMRWSITRLARLWGIVGSIVLVISICIQTILIAHGGILPLQDGQYGYSCLPTEPITIYLAQHYAGGRILEDISDYRIIEAEVEAAELKDFIYEGSSDMWEQALINPPSVVDWIIVPPEAQDDPIVRHINLKSPAFLSHFTLMLHEPDGLSLFHRNGGPLTTRPIASSLITEHRLCSAL